jgi:hypothetical protein
MRVLIPIEERRDQAAAVMARFDETVFRRRKIFV